MDRPALAAEMFDEGLNCAQSVLAVFAVDHGLDRDLALRLAAPLGGDLARTDGLCGAAAGAVLALGLAAGYTDPDDEDGQNDTRELTREFLRRFAARLGATSCTGVLGHDLSQPGVPERVKAEGLSRETCPAAVRCAVEILEELL